MSAVKSVLLATVAVAAVGVGAAIYLKWDEFVPVAAMGVNYVRYMNAPKGELTIETAPDAKPLPAPNLVGAAAAGEKDWPSYNRTLTSNRFAPTSEIKPENAGSLQQICTYDTGEYTGFNTGLLEKDGVLLFSSEYNLYAINANNCHLLWRAHEEYAPATPQGVNRGPALLDGSVFRGTQDGRVIAYDFKTGARLWETRIADPKKGESAPAAPIAWNGLVFIGNAGGDIKGVKGRMYALDAKSGQIVWEFYLVPKAPGDPERGPEAPSPLDASSWKTPKGSPITGGATWTSYTLDPDRGLLYVPGGNPAPDFATSMREGENLYSGSVVVLDARTGAYKTHFKIVPKDWHDWDVSSAPALIATAGGKRLMSVAPKDGHLYGFDLSNAKQLYREPMTKMENEDKPFAEAQSVHFCPGSIGGAEWNGPAYDPQNNLIMVGEVQWCTTVTLKSDAKIMETKPGQPWSGEASLNPYHIWGKQDPVFDWAGWVNAVDADSGQWRWRARSNYPVQSGVTPTAGGVVFFGDMGGNFYALDANDGKKLFGQKIGGAIGGGVIAYDAGKGERVAAATGLTEVLWPTEITTAKVTVLGLPGVVDLGGR